LPRRRCRPMTFRPKKTNAANTRRAPISDCRYKYAPKGGNYRQTWQKNLVNRISGMRGKWASAGLTMPK
jgi:hypothetical protein